MNSIISEYFTELKDTAPFTANKHSHNRAFCIHCNAEHMIDDTFAQPQCFELMNFLEQEKRIDIDSPVLSHQNYKTDYLFGPARGQMFGVLVCRHPAGTVGWIKAFSCQYNGNWKIPGWVPPVFEPDDIAEHQSKEEAEIKAMGEEIEQLSQNSPEYCRLKQIRRQKSQTLMKDIHECYTLTSINGQTKQLKAVIGSTRIPTGMADCCAPKLLNFAARNNLKPLSLAEFYWGKENRSKTKKHGLFYPPCKEKCAPILGFMLCKKQPSHPKQDIQQ